MIRLQTDKPGLHAVLSRYLLVIVAAVTLLATSFIQYYYTLKSLRQEASLRAESELDGARNAIMDIVNQTEAAVRGNIWIAQWCLEHMDSLHRVPQRIVEDNLGVAGSTLALVPGYSKKEPLCAPYVVWDTPNQTTYLISLATEAYDYPSQKWFTEPLKQGNGYWSEPYYDEGGGNLLMTTFSMPVLDRKGRPAAVLTADISLDWLSTVVANMTIYDHDVNTIVSREGQVIVRTGIPPKQGEPCQEYSAQVERTGWTMTISLPEKELFAGIRKVGALVKLLQLLGIVMLVIILQVTARSQQKFQALNEQKERMQSELRIGRNIQMSMIPKPMKDRPDLDFAATIVPAKEVGGDLYDYYIRDNRLFFCVGDVSGKGVPAALVMAVTRSLFRAVSAHEGSPARIMSTMNAPLTESNESQMFVTFFLGVLDLGSGLLRYCNAGHNPPLVLSDMIRELPVQPNLPLGVVKDVSFQEQQIQLRYDDALFLYTDGITEAENAQAEQFGHQRMDAVLHARRSSADHLKAMQDAVEAFVDGAPQSDDMTMLFIHYLVPPTMDNKEHHLILHNDIRQIPRLADFIENIAEEKDLPQSLALSLNLALEEAVTNVILYAYPKGADGLVDVEAILREGSLEFILSDSGTPFDPTAAPEADITLSAEERPIGGLGIYLVRQIMDQVTYVYRDGKNVLSMLKKI